MIWNRSLSSYWPRIGSRHVPEGGVQVMGQSWGLWPLPQWPYNDVGFVRCLSLANWGARLSCRLSSATLRSCMKSLPLFFSLAAVPSTTLQRDVPHRSLAMSGSALTAPTTATHAPRCSRCCRRERNQRIVASTSRQGSVTLDTVTGCLSIKDCCLFAGP